MVGALQIRDSEDQGRRLGEDCSSKKRQRKGERLKGNCIKGSDFLPLILAQDFGTKNNDKGLSPPL
jgi:hypothetical protein